jgi:two-component system CheB/CheR fusion protein
VARAGWREVSLRELIEKELQPYVTEVDRLMMQGPTVLVKPSAAVSVGMVLHEMATNAAKHGALSVEQGRVSVNWGRETIDEAPCLVLHWLESGGPTVTEMPDRRGFGTDLIERQLQHDLKGRLEIDFDPKGLRIMIALPANVIADWGDGAPDPRGRGAQR